MSLLLFAGILIGFWALSNFQRWGALVTAVLAFIGLTCFWKSALAEQSLSSAWSTAFAGLLGAQLVLSVLRTHASGESTLRAIGSCIFVYLMLWIFAMHHREPGLRPLATAALMMSIGILAMPAVAIGCAILSLIFFLDQRLPLRSIVNFFLLLFTPLFLCLISVTVLDVLAWSSIREGLPILLGTPRASTQSVHQALLSDQVPGFSLAAGALLGRLLARQSRGVDLAFFALLVFLATVGRAHWMPVGLASSDISITAYGGAACLVALTPPRTIGGRMVMLTSLGSGLLACVR